MNPEKYERKKNAIPIRFFKVNVINTTNKIVVQNTNIALQDTGIQYSIIVYGNQARYLS